MTNNSSKLIKSEIKGRTVTYYLTTEEDLHNVKNSSLLGNFFITLLSASIAGIISVILTKSTGIQLEQETINVLNILLYVFILGAVIFVCFTTYFLYRSFMTIRQIKGSGTIKSLKSGDQEEAIEAKKESTQKVSKLEILKAEYWTQKVRLDVTEDLRKMIINNKLETIASNAIKGDPDPGTVKNLSIEYKFNDIAVTKQFREGAKVVIP